MTYLSSFLYPFLSTSRHSALSGVESGARCAITEGPHPVMINQHLILALCLIEVVRGIHVHIVSTVTSYTVDFTLKVLINYICSQCARC